MKKVEIQRDSDNHPTPEATELVKFHELPGTPFTALSREGSWSISWSPYIIWKSDFAKSWEDCKEALETDKWQIMATYAVAVMMQYQKNEQQRLVTQDDIVL